MNDSYGFIFIIVLIFLDLKQYFLCDMHSRIQYRVECWKLLIPNIEYLIRQ